MTPYRVRAVLLLFLLLHLTACATWQAVTPTAMSVAQLIEEDRPERVRVLMRNGRQAELERPVIDGDRLVAPNALLPLADILRLEIWKIDLVRSALAGVAVFVGFVAGKKLCVDDVDGSFTWTC
jgi:hypothetical protein